MTYQEQKLAELERMGYRGELDGHDRAWHKSTATSHAEMNALIRGAERARVEIAQSFLPRPKVLAMVLE